MPGAPGTYASAVTAVLWGVIPDSRLPLLPGALLLVAAVGVVASEMAVRETGISDPSFVVIDECLGQGLALLAVPHTVTGGLLAFAAFRFFDILKPPPIRWLETAPGGAGIMLDDVGAGLIAAAILAAAFHFFPGVRVP